MCNISKIAKYAIIITILAIFVVIVHNTRTKTTKKTSSVTSPTKSLQKPNRQDTIIKYTRLLDQYNIDQYKSSKLNVDNGVNLFYDCAIHIELALRSGDKKDSIAATILQNKLSMKQTQMFPLLRKNITDVWYSNLWDKDIDVTLEGYNNENISFTSSIFVRNKNKGDFYEGIKYILYKYRFKEVRFRWYKDQSDYTFYSSKSKNDNQVISYSKIEE